MRIELKRTFATDANVDDYDVKQIKKALNRLGYYMPSEKVGITGIADAEIFKALKDFQKDYNLPGSGSAKPNDETIKILNHEIAMTPDGFYMWRTVEDDRVRTSHAIFNRTVRSWENEPDPGEDFNCRCWVQLLPNNAVERKKAVLGKGKADFRLKPDVNSIDKEPYYTWASLNEVQENDKIIIDETKELEVDPDLVRAIIYVETTQGWYDRFHPWNKTIRPMNIYAEHWQELGYTKEDLEKPQLNIRAGVDLIRRLQIQVPHATIEEIATLYNDLSAKRITGYGARVGKVMKEKPWLEKR